MQRLDLGPEDCGQVALPPWAYAALGGQQGLQRHGPRTGGATVGAPRSMPPVSGCLSTCLVKCGVMNVPDG